jgi:hypothetical protein
MKNKLKISLCTAGLYGTSVLGSVIIQDVSTAPLGDCSRSAESTGGNTNTTIANSTPFPIEITDISRNAEADVHFVSRHAAGRVITDHSYNPTYQLRSETKQTGIIPAGKKYRVLSNPRGCAHFEGGTNTAITILLPYVGDIILRQKIHQSETKLSNLEAISITSGNYYTGDNRVDELWHTNTRAHHTVEFKKGDKIFKVTYYSYFTFGYDDIWCDISYQGTK